MSNKEKRFWMGLMSALLVALLAVGLTGCDALGGRTTVEVCIADCYETITDDHSNNSSQDNNENQNAVY